MKNNLSSAILYTHQNSDMFIQTIMSPAFLNVSEYLGISAKDFQILIIYNFVNWIGIALLKHNIIPLII